MNGQFGSLSALLHSLRTVLRLHWRLEFDRLCRMRLGVTLRLPARVMGSIKAGSLIAFILAFLSGSDLNQESDLFRTKWVRSELSLDDRAGVTWEEERDTFAMELGRAFELPRSDARLYADWIIEASDRQALDRYVMASLVSAESDFIADATSRVGAFGPAQIRRELWQDFCYSADLTDPADNISCAAQILAHFQDRCGSLDCALRSYNVGFKNHSNASPYYVAAGNRYVDKVVRNLAKLERSIEL